VARNGTATSKICLASSRVGDTIIAPTWQGLTLVHFSAQLEPFLTQKHTLNTPDAPHHPLSTPETTPNCTPCHTEGA
jgi:hypothetical protein